MLPSPPRFYLSYNPFTDLLYEQKRDQLESKASEIVENEARLKRLVSKTILCKVKPDPERVRQQTLKSRAAAISTRELEERENHRANGAAHHSNIGIACLYMYII